MKRNKIVTNAGARKNDFLVLTKPIGTGIVATGIKRELVENEVIEEVTKIMSRSNRVASEVMQKVGVNACTDITGFGLLGHLYKMLEASGVGAKIYFSKIPVIQKVWDLTYQKIVPGGTMDNFSFLENKIIWDDGITLEQKWVLTDAQTSGGLLISVSPKKVSQLVRKLQSKKTLAAAIIGQIVEDRKCLIQVLK